MTPQDVAAFFSLQWAQHGVAVHDWITDHTWTLLCLAALLTVFWVRDQKRRGKL